MHLAILAAVLAQVPLPVPYPGGAQDDYQSPIVSLVAWDKGGSQDWGAGIPSPTIDCAAVGTSSSASLQCSGATPSFAGPGQTAAGSPWWYRNDAAVRPSIALNGSTDYWDLGDVGRSSDTYAWCFRARRNSSASSATVFGRRTSGAVGISVQVLTGGGISFAVFKGSASATSLNTTAVLPVGAWGVVCGSYRFVSDGASEMRVNINGTAESLTNAVGPVFDTATNTQIGRLGSYNDLFPGNIGRVAIWTGADAPTSAAQLAQMVATQWGLAADKPAGTVATHARTDSTLCCPFSDAECFWVGPGAPCIHAPTYQGWASGGAVAGGIEVYGIGQNGGGYSEALNSWSESGTAAVSANSHASPDLSVTMDTVTTTGANSIRYITDTVTSSAGPFTHGAWGRSVTGSAVGSIAVECYPQTVATCACSTGRAGVVACTAEKVNSNFDCLGYATLDTTPTRVWVTATCSAAITQPVRLLGGGRWRTSDGAAVWWGSQLTPTAYPVPYRSTPGASSYTGTASTATTLTVPVALTDPSRWAISMTYTGPGAWGVADRFWSLGTAANSAYLAAGYLGIFDAANAQLYSSVSPALASGLHSVLVDYRSPSAALRIDGADRTLSFTGAGSGVLGALSPTVTIGNGPALGLVSRVAQCRKAGGCR